MSLALRCRCSVEFEVEDTYAGQTVSCPGCGEALRAPRLAGGMVRTSGYALASVILALVGAFTVVGTLLAVVFGVVGLIQVARHPNRMAGAGFALFGVFLGLVLSAMTIFALVQGEVFEQMRDNVVGSDIDRGGPLEIVREREGYAITRPSRRWGVATGDLVEQLESGDDLVLAQPGKDAYIQVVVEAAGRQTLAEFREAYLDRFRKKGANKARNLDELMEYTEFQLRESKTLPAEAGLKVVEVVFDVKFLGQKMMYRVRFIQRDREEKVYTLVAWAHRRRLTRMDDEVIQTFDSFRLLR